MKRFIMHELIFLTVCLTHGNTYSQSLKIIYGDRLYHQKGDNLYEIKKVKHCSSFLGYDIVDSSHIFIAYDPETSAEASTYIVVYDVQTQSEKFITELGGTGESFFIYNKINDLVLFNWVDGIYVFKLHDSENKLVDKFETRLIVKGDNYFLPFWVDPEKIGYRQFENGKEVTKYYKMEMNFK